MDALAAYLFDPCVHDGRCVKPAPYGSARVIARRLAKMGRKVVVIKVAGQDGQKCGLCLLRLSIVELVGDISVCKSPGQELICETESRSVFR